VPSANALTRTIHDRMPVFIEPKDLGPWLSSEAHRHGEIISLMHSLLIELRRGFPALDVDPNIRQAFGNTTSQFGLNRRCY